MNEKVSIICQVYNAERYLKQLLNSLLFQTYENFRVYLVNDASSDKSSEILDEVDDDRFVVIHNETKMGTSASRERGYLNSKGEYVLFINSYDYLEFDAIQMIMTEIEKHYADLVIFDYKVINEDHKPLYTFYNSTPLYLEAFPTCCKKNPELLLSKPVLHNKCFKRTLFEQNFTLSDEQTCLELATVPLLIQRARRIQYINEPIYNYRSIHTNALLGETECVHDLFLTIDFLRTNLDNSFREELEFIALSHILVHIKRLPELNKKNTRRIIHQQFKQYIKTHYPNYKKNKYLRKRGLHHVITCLLLTNSIFCNLVCHKILDLIKGNEFLNISVYRYN